MNVQTIILGGGCFWCTEGIFKDIRGVVSVMPGYAGGSAANPAYEDVCEGVTGHAEVVKVEYDADIVSIRDLLEVFFATHDPTTLNRQGADVGTQYRSAIYYSTEEQKQAAEKVMGELTLQKVFENPIVTELKPLTEFYEAEEYHRDYYAKNPGAGYCRAVINPKLEKFRKKFASLLKS